MPLLLVPLLLTCGPAVVSALAYTKLLKEYRNANAQAKPSALWAGGCVLLVTAYAAYNFIRYTVTTQPELPPWKDPETLNLALLFVLAPIGLVFAAIAGFRGASKWVVAPLIAALLVLFFVGLLEAASV